MVRMFLATANVGSVFENIEEGLEKWVDEFLKAVLATTSKFVAVHFQETGGKNYQNCTDEINIFFAELKRRFLEHAFIQVEGFVDSQSDLEEHYTALASIYYIHSDIDEEDVQIWNFKEKTFTPVSKDGSAILHVGVELQNTEKKQKEKFPQDFFPDFKWSRKGFLRTRWKIKNVPMDLVNIHMFHDSCNLIAGSAFPSPFAQNRVKTLNYTLDKLLKNDDLDNCPMFIFGDFNFRLNTYEIFEILRRELTTSDEANDPVPGQEKFRNQDLLIDSKVFSCPDHESRFKYDFNWVRPYEFEAKQCLRLFEQDLNFHPTYPFDEELSDQFMRTRCPAWCDRVLFTENANVIIAEKSQPVYDLIGSEVCMGDHKPVYLSFELKWTHGMELDNSGSPTTEEINDVSEPLAEENSIGNNGSCSSVESSVNSSAKKCGRLSSFFRKRFTLKRSLRSSKRRKTQANVLLESECDIQDKTYSTNFDFGTQPETSRSTNDNRFSSHSNDSASENVSNKTPNPKKGSMFRTCFNWKRRVRKRRMTDCDNPRNGIEADIDIPDNYNNTLVYAKDWKNEKSIEDGTGLMDSQTKEKLIDVQDISTPKLCRKSTNKLVDGQEESKLSMSLNSSTSNNSIVKIQDNFYENSKSLKENQKQVATCENQSGHSCAKCIIS